jgi:hypothetical protein
LAIWAQATAGELGEQIRGFREFQGCVLIDGLTG